MRYVSDARPGISRHKSGKGFTYRKADGGRLAEPRTLARIRKLAIPPAEPLPSTPEDYIKDIESEWVKWSKVVKDAGIAAN